MNEVGMFLKELDKLNNNNHIRDVASSNFYRNFNNYFRNLPIPNIFFFNFDRYITHV